MNERNAFPKEPEVRREDLNASTAKGELFRGF
jgi:hypothetical protein